MIRHSIILPLAAVCLSALANSGWSSPPWWEGRPEDVPAAAAQTGKPVILYFHSPSAADCIRMEEETWRPMNPVWADLQYIWLRLDPRRDAEYFKYWKINQVPQVVILDSQMSDQLRLRGFMSLDQIKDALSRVERGVPSMFTTVSGDQVPAKSPKVDLALLERDPNKGHFYLENFDQHRLIGSISNPPFRTVLQAASRIHTSGGPDGSGCLIVDSGSESSAMIQIDLSSRFSEIDQVLGRIRVNAKLKATSSLGNTPVDVMALNVVRLNAVDKESAEQRYFASLSNKDQDRWVEREIISAPINFRFHKAFILLGVQTPKQSFMVEDLTVDLIPYDDMMPFLEANAEVRTIADLSMDADGEVDPDSFYEKLASKARLQGPAAVANERSPRSRTKDRQKIRLTPAQIDEIAEYMLDLSEDDRKAYIKSLNISRKDFLAISLKIRHLNTKRGN